MGGIGFIVSRNCESFLSLSFVTNQCVPLRLDSNKIFKVSTATITVSDDNEVEEFYDELESTFTIKFTYTVVIADFNAKLGDEGKVERHSGMYVIGKQNDRGDIWQK